MAPKAYPYVILDVFTDTPYSGNPLAIVHIKTDADDLTSAQKWKICQEFNLSETVFLHETPATSDKSVVKIEIYAPFDGELPFAGHPTIGTAWYILSGLAGIPRPFDKGISLQVPAGNIPITISPDKRKAKAQVPVDYKEHEPFFTSRLKDEQMCLAPEDFENGKDGAESIISAVKGMSWILLPVTSLEALGNLQPYAKPMELPPAYLGAWDGALMVLAYHVTERDEANDVITARTRMFWAEGREDAATGSASVAFASYLAKNRGKHTKVEITQGVEMGRKSLISVDVVLKDGEVSKVALEGEAVQIMQGTLSPPGV
ncbi:Diaminopimelate epimerase-like protein [Ascobolus immersus RN42]|uniref:Diaminopimelate epimerase-like protein n=1 Tax=Ascobolus immersus RN42 TaxID=1160509 RepID=A0A3N4IQS0_ASCIM|nr:Diaminopimelate epimerase-like protein [Ascobolus immersus RN42]